MFVISSRNRITDDVVKHHECDTLAEAKAYIEERFSTIGIYKSEDEQKAKLLAYDCPSSQLKEAEHGYVCEHFYDGEYYVYKLTDLLEVFVDEV